MFRLLCVSMHECTCGGVGGGGGGGRRVGKLVNIFMSQNQMPFNA